MKGDGTSLTRLATLCALIVAVGILVTGCGGSGSSLAGPPDEGVDAVAGRRVYDRTCAACHGSGGRGTSKGPPFVDPIYEPSHDGDAAFVFAVRQGVTAHHWQFGDMPPQSGISDADILNVVAYVRALQRASGIS